MWISTDASAHGHAGDAGRPVTAIMTSPIRPAHMAISTVTVSGSRPRLTPAFQAAWQKAANRTAAKTKESMSYLTPLLAREGRHRRETGHDWGKVNCAASRPATASAM